MRLFTSEEFLHLGLKILGFDPRESKIANLRRYKASFAASPETLESIFRDLQSTNIDDARVEKPNPRHLLMAINWLTNYESQEVIAGTFKCDEKTVSKWSWFYTQKICALKGAKVSHL
jgi:hypothetical protein